MSNGLSQAEIDALLQGGSSEPAPPADDPSHIMSPEEIAALLENSSGADPIPAAPPSDDPSHMMSPEEIAALMENPPEPDPIPEAPAAPTSDEPSRMMSPEEIAALLENPPEPDPIPEAPAPPRDFSDALTDQEKDALGEIGNISMGTAATTLFALLNRRVDITTPKVSITTMGELARKYPMPFVSVEVQYTVGLEGTNCLFLQEKDVKIITDLMLGGDGSNCEGELNEMHLSCISEVMNQMVGASSTSMSQMLKSPIDISPPRAMQIQLANRTEYPFTSPDDPIVRTAFNMVVEGLINSEIMQITPISFAKDMVVRLMGNILNSPEPEPAPQQQQAAPPPQPQHSPPPAGYHPVEYSGAAQTAAAAPPPPGMPPQQGMAYNQPYPAPMEYAQPPQAPYPQQQPYPPQAPYPQQPYPYPPPQPYPPAGYGYPPQQPQQQAPVDIHPAQFASFGDPNLGMDANGENMDILMDVPLSVSVELGKSRKYIKDILDFNIGTIVVLDKMAGDLVDVMVNGKLIAQGEVVVIDDSYGCRITEIVSPSKRINPLK